MADGAESDWPDDAVEVGGIVGAWGVKGWIKVKPHAADPQSLFASRRWYLKPPGGLPVPAWPARPYRLSIVQTKAHGGGIVAQVQEIADRNAAAALHGARIFVSRCSFPGAGPDEYYWVDLIGLAVSNRQGEALGRVVGLLDTGPHSVLRVAPDEVPESPAAQQTERLIPFVSAYVDSVSLDTRRIVVDWGLDY